MGRAFRQLRLLLLPLLMALVACGGNEVQRRAAPVHHKPKPVAGRIAPGTRWYRVKKGDTLIGIAWRAGLDYRRLARWNGLKPPYTIYPGQRLRLRPPPKKSQTAQPRPSSHGSKRTTARRAHARPHKPSKSSQSHGKKKTAGAGLHWRWPVVGKVVRRFDRTSNGIDIAVPPGTPVHAAEAGTVVYAGSGLIGFGQLIIIKHNNEFLSAYGHNRRLHVGEGDRVRRGQHISDTGTDRTGRGLLHFEIRRYGRPVNPLAHLPRR